MLCSALEHAVREDDLPRNVARNLHVPAGHQKRLEPLTAAQDSRLHALFDLALRTGMRRSELLGLRWSDLDLTAGTLAIRQTLQYVPGAGLVITATKTPSSERRIALPRECITSLTRHRTQQQADSEAAGPDWTDNGLVFTTRNGTPLHPSNINRDFRKLLTSAGLRKIRFHDLRHSCATLLLDQGANPS